MDDDGNKIKTDKIITSAIKEFSEKGYEKASTAQICKNAGVSKGLLFHHFGTKKGLYIEVYERILVELIGEIDKLDYDDCETYFDSIIKASGTKLRFIAEHPAEYEILIEAYYNPPGEVKTGIEEINNKQYDMEKYFSASLFKNFEYREGIDPYKAWEVIQAVVTVVERKIINEVALNKTKTLKSADKIMNMTDELWEYFDIIFNGIAPQNEDIKKRGRAGEQADDGKGRYKAV